MGMALISYHGIALGGRAASFTPRPGGSDDMVRGGNEETNNEIIQMEPLAAPLATLFPLETMP